MILCVVDTLKFVFHCVVNFSGFFTCNFEQWNSKYMLLILQVYQFISDVGILNTIARNRVVTIETITKWNTYTFRNAVVITHCRY